MNSDQSIVDLKNGLNSVEIQNRLRIYGYNQVTEKTISPIKKFFKKFWGITPWMLEFTIILEFLLAKNLEAFVILGLLVFNAIIGFIQEEKANSAIGLLKQKLSIKARVKRNGEWVYISAKELVPGDLIRLRAGDFVPADINILEGNVEVDQSVITGESMTIERKSAEVLYSGSTVKRGEITGIVIKTGKNTFFGRTVELIQIAKPKLHIQEVISKVVKWSLLIVFISLSFAIILSVLKSINLLEIVPLVAILLVASIPVALPTMFTISMALGSLELSKRGVLITRLDATDDASTMNIICVDKTGTLTMNQLFITNVIPAKGYEENDIILYGALASQEANQDPIDVAFLRAIKEKNIPFIGFEQIEFFPVDPHTRMTEAIIEKNKQQFIVFKGSVNSIVDLCQNGQKELEYMSKEIENLSVKGYRLLAVARGLKKNDIELVGVVGLYDKIRPDTPTLIKDLKDLGISVKILTGDALPIAKEVAEQLHLGNNLAKMSDLKKNITDEERSKIVEKSVGFAEIYPEDKYTIVKSLQNMGHVVGMTGDGVNDAPALKQAEVGIAVSNATDVAKKSSSVVLTTEGLEGIVDLIKTGRMIYQRITTWIINKIIRTFKRVVFIILAFIILGFFIVSTLDMILLLFLSDYVTLSLSTDNVRYSKEPETWNIGGLVKTGVILGIIMVMEGMFLLYIGNLFFSILNNINHLQTFVFVFLTFSGYFTVLAIREKKHFWKSKPSKPLILTLVINSIIVILIASIGIPGLSSIPFMEVIFIIIYTLCMCLLLNDFIKYVFAKKLNLIL